MKKKNRNGSTNAETCTAEVQAHRGADKKAEHRRRRAVHPAMNL